MEKPISIIAYGPRGCGKTTNAIALAEALGHTAICDRGKSPLASVSIPSRGMLVLTDSKKDAERLSAQSNVPLIEWHLLMKNAGLSELTCQTK